MGQIRIWHCHPPSFQIDILVWTDILSKTYLIQANVWTAHLAFQNDKLARVIQLIGWRQLLVFRGIFLSKTLARTDKWQTSKYGPSISLVVYGPHLVWPHARDGRSRTRIGTIAENKISCNVNLWNRTIGTIGSLSPSTLTVCTCL